MGVGGSPVGNNWPQWWSVIPELAVESQVQLNSQQLDDGKQSDNDRQSCSHIAHVHAKSSMLVPVMQWSTHVMVMW